MTDFRDRERAEEAHWSLECERLFKARVLRDRLLGQWAARELGLDGPHSQAYVSSIMDADVETGEQAILSKIAQDFQSQGIPLTEEMVRRQFDRCTAEARQRVD